MRYRSFQLNLRNLTITCPAGETERIEFGSVVGFEPRDDPAKRSRDEITFKPVGVLGVVGQILVSYTGSK